MIKQLYIISSLAILASCTHQYIEPIEQVSFNNHIQPILDQQCISCHHSASTPPVLSSGESYTALSADGYIIPGEPSESELVIKIESGHPSPGVVSDLELDNIRNWIEHGAEDN